MRFVVGWTHEAYADDAPGSTTAWEMVEADNIAEVLAKDDSTYGAVTVVPLAAGKTYRIKQQYDEVH